MCRFLLNSHLKFQFLIQRKCMILETSSGYKVTMLQSSQTDLTASESSQFATHLGFYLSVE